MRIGYFDEDMIAEDVPCGPDLERHLEAIREYEDAGFDELYIQQIGGDHERFFDERFFELYAREVLPHFDASSDGGERRELAAHAEVSS